MNMSDNYRVRLARLEGGMLQYWPDSMDSGDLHDRFAGLVSLCEELINKVKELGGYDA
jgi:hypothetical protein